MMNTTTPLICTILMETPVMNRHSSQIEAPQVLSSWMISSTKSLIISVSICASKYDWHPFIAIVFSPSPMPTHHTTHNLLDEAQAFSQPARLSNSHLMNNSKNHFALPQERSSKMDSISRKPGFWLASRVLSLV